MGILIFFAIIVTIILLMYMLNAIIQYIDGKISVSNYTVQEIPNFLTAEECEYLITLSLYKLFPSRVYSDKDDLYNTDSRKSEQCWLRDDEEDDKRGLVKEITERVNKLTGTDKHFKEDLQIVNYKQGGYFHPHYDACKGTKEYCERMDGNTGPRYLTLLIYLSDKCEGGGTRFPLINKTVKPERGKAVLFYNTDKEGKVIHESLHGGDPVKSGEKWIANKWVRIR